LAIRGFRNTSIPDLAMSNLPSELIIHAFFYNELNLYKYRNSFLAGNSKKIMLNPKEKHDSV
jgi:hypothetical protein